MQLCESQRQLIVCADDFGRDVAVNEAVEAAHRDGILSTASLMVAAPAAADAVARARRLPGLRVGLHLVLVDGDAALPPADMPRPGRRRRPVRRQPGACRFPLFLRAGHAPAARGGDPRAVRGVPRHRPRARPCQRAQAHASAPDRRAARSSRSAADYGMRAVRLPDEPVAALRGAFPGERYRAPAYAPGHRGAAPPAAPRRARDQRPGLRHRLERRDGRGAAARAAAAPAAGRQRNLLPPGRRDDAGARRRDARLPPRRRAGGADQPGGAAADRRAGDRARSAVARPRIAI